MSATLQTLDEWHETSFMCLVGQGLFIKIWLRSSNACGFHQRFSQNYVAMFALVTEFLRLCINIFWTSSVISSDSSGRQDCLAPPQTTFPFELFVQFPERYNSSCFIMKVNLRDFQLFFNFLHRPLKFDSIEQKIGQVDNDKSFETPCICVDQDNPASIKTRLSK